LLPEAIAYAFDINPDAATVCRQAAIINNVGHRLVVEGKCTAEMLGRIVARDKRPLIFMDCEGGELELLDPVQVPLLRRCDIIVETHDFIDRSITATLLERFGTSHTVERVTGGARNPNQFSQLHLWWELDRWLLVDEGRPEIMNWLVCWADQRQFQLNYPNSRFPNY
jgi:hypothetical protein